MNTFYRLYEDGRICDFCEFGKTEKVPSFILEQYKKTDRKIIKSADGNFVFEDEIDIDEEKKRKTAKEFNKSKADKIAELKAARDAAEIEPIEHNGNRFDYDEQARDRLAIARQAIEDGATDNIVWTTADNTRVSLTLDDFKGIGIAAALRSNALHVKYNELKSWVQAAETAEDVAAVIW